MWNGIELLVVNLEFWCLMIDDTLTKMNIDFVIIVGDNTPHNEWENFYQKQRMIYSKFKEIIHILFMLLGR